MSGESIDKNALKDVLEEMLRERNPELKGLIEELLKSYFAGQSITDRSLPIGMDSIRKKYALHREAFVPLHKMFEEAPPAPEIVNKLRK